MQFIYMMYHFEIQREKGENCVKKGYEIEMSCFDSNSDLEELLASKFPLVESCDKILILEQKNE